MEPLSRLERSIADQSAVKDLQGGAAVAAVIDDASSLLFIHRRAYEGDPWSGHLAFPGGRIEDSDPSPRRAAERETMEEVGLDLSEALFVGGLDEITGTTIPLSVSCHVFRLPAFPDLVMNEEVEDSFTMALEDLADPARCLEAEFEIKGERKVYPAIDIGLAGKPLLWGLTYRFVCQLLTHAGLRND